MSKRIQLSIDNPCHENWDNMTPAERGRFCASCQKQVIDFTGMGDSQLAAFFKKPIQSLSKDGSVCGRFYRDQLERDIEIPKRRIPWVKYFFQFALPAFLVSMKATAQGKIKANLVSDQVLISNCTGIMGDVEQIPVKILTGDTILTPVPKAITISGKVVDEENEPIPFATIVIKGTKIGTITNSQGVFEIRDLLKTKFVLQVSSVGYETKDISINERNFKNNIIVKLTIQVMGEIVVVGYGYEQKRTIMGTSSIKTERKVTNIAIARTPEEIPAMIKVYPNPVQSGTNINVGCQKLEKGYYNVQLFNQAGQQVLSKQTWIDDEIQVLNVDIPNVPEGVYFLRLTNRETRKRFTSKVIVE